MASVVVAVIVVAAVVVAIVAVAAVAAATVVAAAVVANVAEAAVAATVAAAVVVATAAVAVAVAETAGDTQSQLNRTAEPNSLALGTQSRGSCHGSPHLHQASPLAIRRTGSACPYHLAASQRAAP